MSIDLSIDPSRPVRVEPLLSKVAAVLAELLGGVSLPPLLIARLEDGELLPLLPDQIGVNGAPFVVISIYGQAGDVGVISGSDSVTVTVSGRRSIPQYALAAATAMALAREMDAGIWDDRRFFGDETYTSPETLLQRLKVTGPQDDFRTAATRIKWGPAGGP